MRPVPYWNGRRTAGVVIAGIGVAGLVVGGVFGAERGGQTSDANAASAQAGAGNSQCFGAGAAQSPCKALANALHSNGTDAGLETAFLIGGGALVAVGAVVTLWPASAPVASAGFSPLTGPHFAGLSWAGTFQ